MKYTEGKIYVKIKNKILFPANLIIESFLKSDNFTEDDQILISRHELKYLVKHVIIEVREVLKNETLKS